MFEVLTFLVVRDYCGEWGGTIIADIFLKRASFQYELSYCQACWSSYALFDTDFVQKVFIGIYVDLSHKGHSENQRSYVSYSEPPLKICEEAEKKNSVN